MSKKFYFSFTNGVLAGVLAIHNYPEGISNVNWWVVVIAINVIGQFVYASLKD